MCSSSPCRMSWQPPPLLHQTLKRKRKLTRIWVMFRDLRTMIGLGSGKSLRFSGRTKPWVSSSLFLCFYEHDLVIVCLLSDFTCPSRNNRTPHEEFEEFLSCRRQRNKQAEEELHQISEKLSHRLEELDQVCVFTRWGMRCLVLILYFGQFCIALFNMCMRFCCSCRC